MQRRRNRGRPPRYRSLEELREKIEKYFKDCEGRPLINQKTGEPAVNRYGQAIMVGEEPPTVTGLAYALGFRSRQSLLNYQGKPAFEELITDAKLRIEAYTERRLFDRSGVNGAKFSLANNWGWGKESEEPEDNDGYDDIMAEVRRRLEGTEFDDRYGDQDGAEADAVGKDQDKQIPGGVRREQGHAEGASEGERADAAGDGGIQDAVGDDQHDDIGQQEAEGGAAGDLGSVQQDDDNGKIYRQWGGMMWGADNMRLPDREKQ